MGITFGQQKFGTFRWGQISGPAGGNIDVLSALANLNSIVKRIDRKTVLVDTQHILNRLNIIEGKIDRQRRK